MPAASRAAGGRAAAGLAWEGYPTVADPRTLGSLDLVPRASSRYRSHPPYDAL